MRRLLRWVRGEVEVRVRGAELERFLNRCAQQGIELEHIRRTELDEMETRLSVRQFRALPRAHRRSRCRIHILRKRGLPFIWHRYRFRWGLWLGLAVCILTCVELKTRIWVVRTEISDNLDEYAVMRLLSEYGVHTGVPSKGIDAEAVRVHMLRETEDLAYFHINVDGCVLTVTASDVKPVPEVEQKSGVRDVVAVKDGVIQKQIIYRGTPQFKTNDSVVRGQILVDALVKAQTEWGTDRLVDASGDIWALTKNEMELTMPSQAEKKCWTGKQRTRYALCIGKTRVNFYRKRCPSAENCDRISLVRYVRINTWLKLPVALYSETCREYTTRRVTLPETQQKMRLLSGARKRALAQMTEGSRNTVEMEYASRNGRMTAQAAAWCYEQIGEQVEDGRTPEDIPSKQDTQNDEESET